MTTAGLDVSTYVGMGLVGDGNDRGKVVHLGAAKGFERLDLIRREVRRTLEIWSPELVMIEHYAYNNRFTLVTLVEVGTVVRGVLYDMRLPWYEVPPSTLKRWVTGSGAAKKDKMKEVVKQRWGYTSPSDDIVDAYALAQLGQLGTTEFLKVKGVALGE